MTEAHINSITNLCTLCWFVTALSAELWWHPWGGWVLLQISPHMHQLPSSRQHCTCCSCYPTGTSGISEKDGSTQTFPQDIAKECVSYMVGADLG